jgi:hypothetical protein
MPIGTKIERRIDQDWRRQYQIAEEDRLRLTSVGWDRVGYRYFRSPNVVCIEHYRRIAWDAIEPLVA